jgi:hypothetical protein
MDRNRIMSLVSIVALVIAFAALLLAFMVVFIVTSISRSARLVASRTGRGHVEAVLVRTTHSDRYGFGNVRPAPSRVLSMDRQRFARIHSLI